MPYCFWRSSIKFQGHMGPKINDLNPSLSKNSRPVAAIKSLRFALFLLRLCFYLLSIFGVAPSLLYVFCWKYKPEPEAQCSLIYSSGTWLLYHQPHSDQLHTIYTVHQHSETRNDTRCIVWLWTNMTSKDGSILRLYHVKNVPSSPFHKHGSQHG